MGTQISAHRDRRQLARNAQGQHTLGTTQGAPPGHLEDTLGSPAAQPRVPELLSIEAAATWLGISRAGLYRLVNSGTFAVPVIGVGNRRKLARRQLERWLDGSTKPDVVVDEPTAEPSPPAADFFSWLDQRGVVSTAHQSPLPNDDPPTPTRGHTRST